MSRKKPAFFSAVVLVTILAFAVPAAAQQAVPDLSRFGFGRVVASADLQPGQAATVGNGEIKAEIPANAFSDPVRFEILQGENSTFQPYAPAGEVVVTNFAFRVTDLKTGQLVGMFEAPVKAVIDNPAISTSSGYYDVEPGSPIRITKNPVPPEISGTELVHPIKGAGVGWVILDPAGAPGLPETGGMSVGALVGGVLILAGGVMTLYLLRSAGSRV